MSTVSRTSSNELNSGSGNSRRITSPRILLAARLVWGFFAAITIPLTIWGLWIQLPSGELALPMLTGLTPTINVTVGPIAVIIKIIVVLVYIVVGLGLLRIRSDDWHVLSVSLAFVIVGGLALSGAGNSLKAQFEQYEYGNTLKSIVDVLVTFGDVSMLIAMLTLPNGRFVPSWSWWVIVGWMIVMLPVRLGLVGTLPWQSSILLDPGVYFLVIGAMSYRYFKIAKPLERQQTKWIILGGGITLFGLVAYLALNAVHELLGLSVESLVVLYLIQTVLTLSSPIGLVFALVRFRVYEVDLYVNRGVVYVALSVLLGALFLGIFIGVPAIFRAEQNLFITLIAVGAVAAMFNPARLFIQDKVDRYLYGLRYGLADLAKPAPTAVVKNPGALTGQTINEKYKIAGVIGKGGMGEVYLAKHVTLGQLCAVKALTEVNSGNKELLRRIKREARMIANLQHNNIVQLYDHGDHNDTYYIVMELLDGDPLDEMLKKGPLAPCMAFEYITKICDALDHAHARRIVHRDIKPSNVMIRPNNSAVLMDFGIARQENDPEFIETIQLTGTTGMIGTLDYISPEQVKAAKSVDHRADIYSLGVMMYQMLTGELPFKGGVGQVVFAHLQQPPPRLADDFDDVPTGISGAIMRAMSKAPEDRYSKASDFAAALIALEDVKFPLIRKKNAKPDPTANSGMPPQAPAADASVG
jgi:hypothetical protein